MRKRTIKPKACPVCKSKKLRIVSNIIFCLACGWDNIDDSDEREMK